MMPRRGAGRLPVYLLPALAVLALVVAAGLLWLQPADPALAQDDAKGPKITAGPAIASSPASGDTYRAGESITVTLTFSEPVTVTGKPRLRLKIGDQKRWARYQSAGADGATLSFTHTVKADDDDADGVSIGKNQLKLNGGTIADADGNAARLKHPKLAAQAGHKVNGAPDEPEPTPTPTPQPQEQAGQQQQASSNSEPQFAGATAARSVAENIPAGQNVGAAITAEDEDGDTLTHAVTGADAGSFDFDPASGQITVRDALDYEGKASYSVTISVHDGKNAAGEADATVDDAIEVAIAVINVDEPGMVLFDAETPQVGSQLSAIVFDPDGGVRDVLYVWQISADRDSWDDIPGVDQGTYTPSDDDLGKYLRATASYADAHGGYEIKYTGWAVTARPVQQPPVNSEPQFAGATAARSVAENIPAGQNVGAAITAEDEDGDTLTHAVTGADAGSFDFDPASGQITVRDALDYEGKASYSVTISVHDGKNAAGEADATVDDAIEVAIAVINVDEPGMVLFDADVPQAGSELSAIVFDPDGGVTGGSWTWARSADGSRWTDIAGATAASYTSADDDLGKYLRATASYADGEGTGKTAQASTAGAVADDAFNGAVIVTIANPPPSVIQGPILNSPARGDTYGGGEEIVVSLTFSEPVTVSGTPRLGVIVGENRRWAKYSESVAGGATLVFSYAVKADDRDDDGIRIRRNALRLNGGSIADGGGNPANLDHPAVAPLATHQVDGSASPFPGQPQQGQSATVAPSAPTGFQAISHTDDQVSLSWADPNDASITKYQYRYKKVANSATSGSTTADTADTGYTQWIDMTGSSSATDSDAICLAGGTKYKFEVRAVNAIGPGPAAAYNTDAVTGAALTPPTTVFNITTTSGLIPRNSGLTLGDSFRLMFISQWPNTPAAASSEIAHYNACAALAAKAHITWSAGDLHLRFRALVSTQTTDARDNTATTYTNDNKGIPIFWPDNNKVVDDYEDFYDGDWDLVINRNVSGIPISPRPTQIWTGSTAAGTKAGANGANAAGADRVAYGTLNNYQFGYPGYGTETLYKGTEASAKELPIYVISPVITITAPPATEKPARPANLQIATGDGQVKLKWDDPQNTSITKYQYGVQTWVGPGAGFGIHPPSDDDYADIPGSGADTTSAVISTMADGTPLTNGTPYKFYIRAVNPIGPSVSADGFMTPHGQPAGFTSNPQDGDTYKNGEVITVRFNFTVPAQIVGTPVLDIMIGSGITESGRWAQCFGVPSTLTDGSFFALECRYTVQTGDLDADGIHVEPNRLTLPVNVTFQSIISGQPKYTNIRFVHPAYRPASVQKVDGSQTPPPAPQTVPANWELIPGGLSVGNQFRMLFVTSAVGYALPTADIADSNKIVRDLATANANMVDDDGNNFGRQFRAVISTASVDARDNTVTTGAGVPIYWVKGDKVADNYADFYDGAWDSTAPKTENGVQAVSGGGGGSMFGREVWTGSNADGTKHASNYAGASQVRYGWLDRNPISDNQSGLRTSGNGFAYYGLSPALTVVPPLIPARPTGFKASAGNGLVVLTWRDPGDSRITKWQYRYKEGSGNAGDYGDWTDIPSADATTYTVTGLTNGEWYAFQVRAVIGETTGPASAEQSARPATSTPAAQITAIRLKRDPRPWGVDVTTMGSNLIIEVEYNQTVSYDAVNPVFPLHMSGSHGGGILELARYSDENLKNAHFQGERSENDFNTRYAEVQPTSGKVIKYLYTVRWGDVDGDGVSYTHPVTGAVATSSYNVNGSRGSDPFPPPYSGTPGLSYCERDGIDAWIEEKAAELGKPVKLWYRDMAVEDPVAYRHAWDALDASWQACFGDRERREGWMNR